MFEDGLMSLLFNHSTGRKIKDFRMLFAVTYLPLTRIAWSICKVSENSWVLESAVS